MANTLKPVVIVGGLRIPFCRSNSAYAHLSNKQMLSTVLNGMVDRFELQGQVLGEVNAGAVISHSRDWNLAREAVLSTRLSAQTPGNYHAASLRHLTAGCHDRGGKNCQWAD